MKCAGKNGIKGPCENAVERCFLYQKISLRLYMDLSGIIAYIIKSGGKISPTDPRSPSIIFST